MTVAIEVDVRDLAGSPGSTRHVHLEGPVPGLGTEMARLPEGRPVAAELVLEGIAEGVLASGTLECVMTEICARCLRPFESRVRVEVHELFAPGAAPDDDDYPLPPEGVIDVEPMVRDAVGVELPFSPLCRPDCLGLCERCGGDRNLGECMCGPETDVRWSALSELTFPDEETT